MKCQACGASMSSTATQCAYCGSYVDKIEKAPSEEKVVVHHHHHYETAPTPAPSKRDSEVSYRSKTVALLLCLFLGWLGVHRFYLGKIGTGILYALTTGFWGAGVLVDIIALACGKMRDKDGRLVC